MTSDLLSQDEIDALLNGVDSGVIETEEPPQDPTVARTYDFASQDRIVRGRLPTLEMINERFARTWRIGLFNLLRKTPEISVGSVRVVKYSAFLRDIVVPTNINIISVQPLRGSALVIFDPNLVFCVIDSLFGGSGKFHLRIEGRDFSPTEQRIIHRMLEVTLEQYTRAWGALCRFNFGHQRSEMHTQFANVASPSEIVVATTFNIEIGDSGGEIHICFPYSTLEPIRDVLYSSVQGDGQEPDRRWVQQLTQQVQAAEIELTAELARTTVTVGELMKLRAGDFVELPLKELIHAHVDGVPVMECRFGAVNGHTALRIERMLKYSRLAESGAIERTD